MKSVKQDDKGSFHVNLTDKYLKKLPSPFLEGVTVKGHFSVHTNNLTTCAGLPARVEGHCSVANNRLTTLEGCPEHVGRVFTCHNNNLKSLDGAPRYVGENFYCDDNAVEFTEEQVRAVCEVKGEVITKKEDR